MRLLNKKRIVITRPRKRAQSFAKALRALGADPIIFPMIDISPVKDATSLDGALNYLAGYDWLVMSSAHAVEAVWARLRALQIRELPETLKFASVGPKTAASLTKMGVQSNFVPKEFKAEAVLTGLGDLEERWVLLPTADRARDALPDAISKAGGVAHVVTAYHTVPTQPDPDGLNALREGVELTLKGLKDTLVKVGLKEVEAKGEPFDPCFHHAVSEQDNEDVEAGIVLEELQKGYMLYERLIRPSMVVLSKGRPGSGDSRDKASDRVCEQEI